MANTTNAGLSLFGTVAGAYSQYQTGQARRAISKANERIAAIQARLEKGRGEEAEARSRQAYKKLLGKQRAALAAQGISLQGDTSQQIQKETEVMSELDALTIRLNASRRAFGLETEAAGSRLERKFEEAGTRQSIFSSLLTGGVKAYKEYKG